MSKKLQEGAIISAPINADIPNYISDRDVIYNNTQLVNSWMRKKFGVDNRGRIIESKSNIEGDNKEMITKRTNKNRATKRSNMSLRESLLNKRAAKLLESEENENYYSDDEDIYSDDEDIYSDDEEDFSEDEEELPYGFHSADEEWFNNAERDGVEDDEEAFEESLKRKVARAIKKYGKAKLAEMIVRDMSLKALAEAMKRIR